MKKFFSSPTSRRALILIIILIAAAAGIWYYLRQIQATNGRLTASGTVEAIDVQVAPEISGRVLAILVNEGAAVQEGQVLFRLDDSMLQAQRQQAQAALQVAQDNLAAADSGITAAQAALQAAQDAAEAARSNTEAQLIPARQALQDLYDNAGVARAAAWQTLSVATKAVRDAQYMLDNFTVPVDQKNMTALEALAVMKARLDQARADFEPYKYEDSGNATRKDLKEALDNAQSAYDSAVRRLELESALSQANERQQKALKDYEALQDGPKAEDVTALKATIAALEAAPKQAASAVRQAEINITQAQDRKKQARSSLEQAQAALDMIDLQIQKSVVSSPTAGVLLSRGIEPGEVVQAGASVLVIGNLESLNITVYVPEDRYGNIRLGQEVQVAVDSFPGKTFTALVTYISDQAEFTPRNVQTIEGRKSTVYAVKLTIANPEQLLKPGMPADVVFE
jgi:HlyD family secretion protein